MFGQDEFGNTRLVPVAFALVFVALGIAMIMTSQTMWGMPDAGVIGALSHGG